MNHNPFIDNLPPLGQGTWRVGEDPGRRAAEVAALRLGLDLGLSLVDTAEMYGSGGAEEVVGEGLQGVRDEVVIASKLQAGPRMRRAAMMERLEGSLRRLRTDYVDVYFNHAVNDVDRMKNPEWHEFTEKARQQGKIRFRGMSGHAGRLIPCLHYALDHDLVDVVLVARLKGAELLPVRRYDALRCLARAGFFPLPSYQYI